MSGKLLTPAALPQALPVQIVQPLNDVHILALVAAQIAATGYPSAPDLAVAEAVEIVAEAVVAVNGGKLHHRCQELAQKALEREQNGDKPILKLAAVPDQQKPA